MIEVVSARYVDGRALIGTKGPNLEIARRDDDAPVGSCPLELLSAALAS